MSRLLQWLRALRIFARNQPLCPEQAPEWTDSDAKALSAFLGGSAGRKLVLRFRYQEQSVNASAVTRTSNFPFNSGYACGFRASGAVLISLSANVPPHPDDDSQSFNGAEELAERHAP